MKAAGGSSTAEVTQTGELDGALSGEVDYIRGGGNLANNNEMLWAFQGTRDGNDVTPESFVSVIGNEADGGNRSTPNLDNTGLSPDNGAIIIDGDHDYVVFDGFDSLPDPLSSDVAIEAISDLSNWSTIGGGFNFTNDNPNPDGGFDLTSPRTFDPADVTTLFFSGINVGFFDEISSSDGDVSSDISITDQPFLPTDVVEIDILNSSIRADGEFDYDEVIFTAIRVRRGDDVYEFTVDDGSKVKESGASGGDPGQAVEQGDTFFTLNDEVEGQAGTPFAGLSGQLAFANGTTFVAGQTANIVRETQAFDTDGDPIGLINANYHVGANLDPEPPIPCFAKGTRIMTDMGPIPIEELCPGDRIVTRDNGVVPLRWVGGRTVSATGRFAPIRIRAGALGNDRDLLVSPGHKMLLTGWQAELYLGEPEVLVPAKHLTNDHDIWRDISMNHITYMHLLFDRHEVVYAESSPSESLDPAYLADWPEGDPSRVEVATLFPELINTRYARHKTARVSAKSYEGLLLAAD